MVEGRVATPPVNTGLIEAHLSRFVNPSMVSLTSEQFLGWRSRYTLGFLGDWGWH